MRHEASRHFRNKKRGYPKGKIMNFKRTLRTRTSETYIEE
jgi:hypothetical protein